MIINSEKSHYLEKVNSFNKLMINTIKSEGKNFEFQGKYYLVCSDGICVQTLINDSVLYRILIKDDKKNSSVCDNLLSYLNN